MIATPKLAAIQMQDQSQAGKRIVVVVAVWWVACQIYHQVMVGPRILLATYSTRHLNVLVGVRVLCVVFRVLV